MSNTNENATIHVLKKKMKVNKASDSTCKHRAADWIARKPLFFLNFVFGTRYHLLENNMNKYRVRDTNFYVKNKLNLLDQIFDSTCHTYISRHHACTNTMLDNVENFIQRTSQM